MVRSSSIDFQYAVIMRDSHVYQLVQEVLWCRLADEKPHMFEGGGSPGEEDKTGDANRPRGIQKPDLFEVCSDN